MRTASPLFFVLAACAGQVWSQTFPDEASLPGCGETCLDSLISQGSALGCPDESPSCLCGVADFTNGVHDCAYSACATDLFPSVTNYLIGVCATATISSTYVAYSTTAAEATSVYVPVATTSSYVAETTVAPYSSSTEQYTTYPATTSSYAPTTTADAANSTSSGVIGGATQSVISSSGTSTSASALTTTSSTKSSSSKTTGTNSASSASSTSTSTSSSSATATAAPTTLSVGAKAGIGIGSAVGAVAAIGAVVACCVTRKHRKRAKGIKISDPLPGAGRVYAGGHQSVSELEMKSRRYEDMVPRHVPRNVV